MKTTSLVPYYLPNDSSSITESVDRDGNPPDDDIFMKSIVHQSKKKKMVMATTEKFRKGVSHFTYLTAELTETINPSRGVDNQHMKSNTKADTASSCKSHPHKAKGTFGRCLILF